MLKIKKIRNFATTKKSSQYEIQNYYRKSMKKPIIIFIIGMIVGATLLAIGYLIAANIDYDTTEYFKTAEECREDIGKFMVKEQISKDKVFAYVNCGKEITFVADLIGIDEDHFPMALLITPNKKSYYDNNRNSRMYSINSYRVWNKRFHRDDCNRSIWKNIQI